MAQFPRAPIIGNFKPSKLVQLKEKAKDPRADREGNCEKHLAAIRKLPCCIPGCSVVGSDAHHLKATGARGAGMRSPDKFAVPLCHFEHHLGGVEKIGSKSELKWFSDKGIEALDLANALWGASPDAGKMAKIVLEHKRGWK